MIYAYVYISLSLSLSLYHSLSLYIYIYIYINLALQVGQQRDHLLDGVDVRLVVAYTSRFVCVILVQQRENMIGVNMVLAESSN